MNKLFLIITANKYPEGDAGAVRQHSFAKIFKTLGFTPIVIGIGQYTGFKTAEYDGVKYYSVRYFSKSLFFRLLGRLLFSYHVKKILSFFPKKEIKGILIVSGGEGLFCYIKSFSQKNGITLFHDSVEWYSASEFKNGEKNRAYIANNNLNTKIIDKSCKVFAISLYLCDYFKSKGISVLRVPVIMDVNKIRYDKTEPTDVIKIVYAGAIGGKDNIAYVLKAIEQLDVLTKKKIRFYIIGSTQKQYEALFEKIDSELTKESVVFVGRVARSVVLDYLKDADFTILLRPDGERYAKAGFPTKVVESLASGTPVICNYTSDLNMYLKDGENAIIVKECSADACKQALQRVVNLSCEERSVMRNKARKTSVLYFDWSLFIEPIKKFVCE